MRRFVVALMAGLIAAALPVGVVRAADPPVAVASPPATDAGVTALSPAAGVDSSHYRFYNGYWWYWTPDNRWLCYVNGQWVSPSPTAPAGPPVQASAAVYPYPSYAVVPQPYYGPYPYGYGYPYPYYGGGGISVGFGGGWGGGWHGGYGGWHR